MTSHVRRNVSQRVTRSSENHDSAAASVKQHYPSATSKTTNSLNQGAKRPVLHDVTNRAPTVVVERSGKASTQAAKRSSNTRTARREPVVTVIAPIPEHKTFDTEETDDEDVDGGMDVDELDIASSQDVEVGGYSKEHPVFAPECTASDRAELQRVSDEFVDEWDEWGDISMVQEYADDIFTYMHSLEVKFTPNHNYMDHQNELEWKMRGILIDWLVQVHARFNLLPETLFLTVNYIDRFLSAKNVSLAKLQLVGITGLFLASKYEEIQCPSVAEIVYMVDKGYKADEILKAERFMVGMLDFELGWPGPLSFLRRISKADDYDVDTRTVAKYILETMLMSERFVSCPPSFAAAIADYTSRAILGKDLIWTDAHVFFSTYTEAQILPAVEILYKECLENGRENHAAIFDKYANRKHKKVSLFVESYLQKRAYGV